MRKTSFHLDQESTIISMLTLGRSPGIRPPSKPTPMLLVIVAGVGVAFVIAYLVGGPLW